MFNSPLDIETIFNNSRLNGLVFLLENSFKIHSQIYLKSTLLSLQKYNLRNWIKKCILAPKWLRFQRAFISNHFLIHFLKKYIYFLSLGQHPRQNSPLLHLLFFYNYFLFNFIIMCCYLSFFRSCLFSRLPSTNANLALWKKPTNCRCYVTAK